MNEQAERAALIREALTWKGTPFYWEACVKKIPGKERGGVDCGRFIAGSANNASIRKIDIAALPRISSQWFMHRSNESFVNVIKLFATEYCAACSKEMDIPAGVDICPNCGSGFLMAPQMRPRMGDIVIVREGRDWSHSALVIDWPRVIGSANEHCVTVWENLHVSPQYMNRKMRFFTFWPKQ